MYLVPSGRLERGIAVGEGRSDRVEHRDLGQLGDVLRDAVVAAPGVDEDVAVDATGVGEQMDVIPARPGSFVPRYETPFPNIDILFIRY